MLLLYAIIRLSVAFNKAFLFFLGALHLGTRIGKVFLGSRRVLPVKSRFRHRNDGDSPGRYSGSPDRQQRVCYRVV